jgi:hypothetical protein
MPARGTLTVTVFVQPELSACPSTGSLEAIAAATRFSILLKPTDGALGAQTAQWSTTTTTAAGAAVAPSSQVMVQRPLRMGPQC